MAKEKVFVQIGNDLIELKNDALDIYLADKKKMQEETRLFKVEQTAKAEAKESALTKLKALGLTETEINAIIL